MVLTFFMCVLHKRAAALAFGFKQVGGGLHSFMHAYIHLYACACACVCMYQPTNVCKQLYASF